MRIRVLDDEEVSIFDIFLLFLSKFLQLNGTEIFRDVISLFSYPFVWNCPSDNVTSRNKIVTGH